MVVNPGQEAQYVTVPPDALDGSRLATRLARRRPGEHVWVVAALYEYSEQEIRLMKSGMVAAVGNARNVLAVHGIACYVCEQSWRQTEGKPCTGDPAGE